jgi:hypothetical protein
MISNKINKITYNNICRVLVSQIKIAKSEKINNYENKKFKFDKKIKNALFGFNNKTKK